MSLRSPGKRTSPRVGLWAEFDPSRILAEPPQNPELAGSGPAAFERVGRESGVVFRPLPIENVPPQYIQHWEYNRFADGALREVLTLAQPLANRK
jgi:hypothetical protein